MGGGGLPCCLENWSVVGARRREFNSELSDTTEQLVRCVSSSNTRDEMGRRDGISSNQRPTSHMLLCTIILTGMQVS